MFLFLFRSAKVSGVYAFAEDTEGKHLPADFAPWRSIGGQTLPDGAADAVDLGVVASAIADRGYFLVSPNEAARLG